MGLTGLFLATLAITTSCSGGSSGSAAPLADSDGDGLPDALEARLESDPLDPDDPYDGGALDTFDAAGPPGDRIPDGLERHLATTTGRTPISASSDADFDGIPDYLEVRYGFDWLDYDDPVLAGNEDNGPDGPAGDGIQDGLEVFLTILGAARPITRERDSDGDAIEDVLELHSGTDPFDGRDPSFGEWIDVDGDGLSDAFELAYALSPLNGNRPIFRGGEDADDGSGPPQDGITDGLEAYLHVLGAARPLTARSDADADGVPDYLEAHAGSDPFDPDDPRVAGGEDRDGDGVSDALEGLLAHHGAPLVSEGSDLDGDRVPDVVEIRTGADPFVSTAFRFPGPTDADGDGAPDALELWGGSDPDDPDSPLAGGAQDADEGTGPAGDGISDAFEALALARGATAPVSTYSDADGDGLGDLIELILFSDPLDADSPEPDGDEDVATPAGPAGDGISDAVEAVLLALGLPEPITPGRDLDDDGIPDVVELRLFTDARDATSPPPNEVVDVDGDGAPDYLELLAGSDPLDPGDPAPMGTGGTGGTGDADRDGVLDGLEACLARLGVTTDVDRSTDSDGDGLVDVAEVLLPSRFLDADHPAPGGGDLDDETGPAGDGISDALELYLIRSGARAPVTRLSDSDDDGVFDLYEVRFGSDAFDPADPFPPGQGHSDDDGDGIPAAIEGILVRLGALAAGPAVDLDADFAPDYLELRLGMDPERADDPAPGGSADLDGDDIPESVELVLQALGAGADVDGFTDGDADGVSDVLEVVGPLRSSYVGLPAPDPGDPDLPWTNGGGDADDGGDGGGPPDLLSDGFERMLVAIGAVPPVEQRTDTDGDGAPDWLEVAAVTHPLSPNHPVQNGGADSDGDGLTDALERVLVRLGATPPVSLASDSDTDGIPDWFEVAFPGHPLDGDHPLPDGGDDRIDVTGPAGDGISDGLEAFLIRLGADSPVRTFNETDGDGLPDYIEVRSGSSPFDPDSPLVGGAGDVNDETGPAGDGITDALELYLIGIGAAGPVTFETDTDGDGVPDVYELLYGTDPLDPGSAVTGTPPMALDLRIEGFPFVGERLRGTYRYFDADNEAEGDSVLEWLRNGFVLPGETHEHVVVEEDFGAFLTFRVTPVSAIAFPPSTAVGPTSSVTLQIAPPDFRGEGGPGGLGDGGSTGPRVWFRADHGVETLPGSDRVARWRSALPGGAPATALTAGREPVFDPAFGPRAVPALLFDGGEALEAPGSTITGFTLMAVASTVHGGSEHYVVGQSTPGLLRNLLLGVRGTSHLAYVRSSLVVFNGLDTLDGRPHLLSSGRDAFDGSGSAFADGLRQGGFTTFLSPISNPGWLLGAGSRTGAFYRGELYEVIVQPTWLGRARRQIVEHYFFGRHGIEPQGSLLLSEWRTHGQDVCGIGRVGSDVIDQAEGTGPLGMSAPTALSNNDFLLWGHDAGPEFDVEPFGMGGFAFKTTHDWAIQVTDGGAGDGVGEVDVTLRLNDLPLLADPERWALMLTGTDGSLDLRVPTRYDVPTRRLVFRRVDLRGVERLSFALK